MWQALDVLHAERIDHGVRCEEDAALLERLVRASGVPLTMCPLSNVRLRVVDRLEDHNLKRLLDRGVRVSIHSDDPAYFGGVRVSIHSDDPAYFGGYVGDNYLAAGEPRWGSAARTS